MMATSDGENANYDESDWSSTRQHLTTHTFLADEEKGTMEQLKSRIGQHYHDNKANVETHSSGSSDACSESVQGGHCANGGGDSRM